MSVRVRFRWPASLVARIDAARGSVPRSVFVRRAVEGVVGPGPTVLLLEGRADTSGLVSAALYDRDGALVERFPELTMEQAACVARLRGANVAWASSTLSFGGVRARVASEALDLTYKPFGPAIPRARREAGI